MWHKSPVIGMSQKNPKYSPYLWALQGTGVKKGEVKWYSSVVNLWAGVHGFCKACIRAEGLCVPRVM